MAGSALGRRLSEVERSRNEIGAEAVAAHSSEVERPWNEVGTGAVGAPGLRCGFNPHVLHGDGAKTAALSVPAPPARPRRGGKGWINKHSAVRNGLVGAEPWQQQDQASKTTAFLCHRDPAAPGLPRGGSREARGLLGSPMGLGALRSFQLPCTRPWTNTSCAATCAQPFRGVLGQGKPSTQAPERQRPQGSAEHKATRGYGTGCGVTSASCSPVLPKARGCCTVINAHETGAKANICETAAERHPQSGEPPGDTARGSPWGGLHKKTLGNRCTDNGLQAGLQTPGWAPCCPKAAHLGESSRKIWERGQWETRTCTAGTQSWTNFAEALAGISWAAPRPARRRRGCCTELSGVGITPVGARLGTHQASRSAGRVCAITESRFLARNNSVYQSAEGRQTEQLPRQLSIHRCFQESSADQLTFQ